jgi:general secretion pathway protein H
VIALDSAPPSRSRYRVRAGLQGFTLLEVLVVIVIVGVIVSVATISVGVLGRDREMQEQAERVWAVLQQAKEECELQGFDVGLRVGTDSYDFLRFDARQQLWVPIHDDDLMGPRAMPPGLRLRLRLEGREVILTDRPDATDSIAKQDKTPDPPGDKQANAAAADDNNKKQELPPQIMVLASGDLNSFDLQVEREGSDARWHVFSRPDSTVVAEQVHDDI